MATEYNEKDVEEFKRQLKAWARSYQAENLRVHLEYYGERFYFGREFFDAIKKTDWPDEKKTRYTNALKLLNAGRPYEEVVDALNGDEMK